MTRTDLVVTSALLRRLRSPRRLSRSRRDVAVVRARPHRAADVPTPRVPDGHPDLSGVWGGGGGGGGGRPVDDDGSGNLSGSLSIAPLRAEPGEVQASIRTSRRTASSPRA